MAQYQTGDGRWLVGDVTGESSYHGFLGWRDCVIQLTGEGATEQSVHYLEALRDYALAHNPLGEPIMPPSINVWISNNGTTTAVQADDLSIDGDKFTIGGIVWDGSTWDYSDAGKASGGGSDPGYTVTEERVVVIPEQTVTTTKISTDDPCAYGPFAFAESVGINDLPQTLSVTFNGTEYECEKVVTRTGVSYGASFNDEGYNFSVYPFALDVTNRSNTIATADAQTGTIKAEDIVKTIEVSEDFQMARGYWADSSLREIVPYQEITTWESSAELAGYTASLRDVAATEYPDTMTAFFNGAEYELAKKTIGVSTYYGATVTVERASVTVDWSEYPFIVMFSAGGCTLKAESNSPATIECVANVEGVVVSDDFKKAVESAVGTQEDIYDLELVYRESKGDYSARIPGDGLPIDNMITLLDSHKAFYFYIPASDDAVMGLRVFVDCINRGPASVSMSGSVITNGTLSVYSGSMNSRDISLFITKTDYTLTPAT